MHQHTVMPLATLTTPDTCFDHVHLDLMGPLPPCKGYSYILTCVDRFTYCPEAFPLPDITTSTVADALPSVLLGICSCLREDLHCITSELVYDTTLCLPGEFLGAGCSRPNIVFISTSGMQRLTDIYIIHIPMYNSNNEFILKFILREIKMADFEC